MRCSLSMYVYSSREQLWCRGQGAFLERCVFLHLLSYQSHDHLRSLFTFCACPCSQHTQVHDSQSEPEYADDKDIIDPLQLPELSF